ncbi:hypothetical protein H2204_010801 [Knufia peltigerae]|uniref:BRCT domain-containing protein n=1 Tax=Knufia peltigerae TaxID=1002370 RepID=A0AA38XVJ2_9EURO|nr:hypothetical protein H2204_010801 [Knufia peltigerae]
MGKAFRNITVASTGDFGDKTDKIKNWVEHAGGTFSKDVTPSVTHLVTSKKAWKRYHPMVQAARRLKTIHIVSLDWLEDSLTMTKSRRPLNETRYCYEKKGKIVKVPKVPRKRARAKKDSSTTAARTSRVQGSERDDLDRTKDEDDDDDDDDATGGVSLVVRKRDCTQIDSGSTTQLSPKKKKKQQQEQRSRGGGEKDRKAEEVHCPKDQRVEMTAREYEAECDEFVREMGTNGYRPFIDSKGFIYLLTLVRKDILQNRLEKHRLKVRYASCVSSVSSSSSCSVLSSTSPGDCVTNPTPSTTYPLTNQEPQDWSKLSNEEVRRIHEHLRVSEPSQTNIVDGHETIAVPKAYMPSYSVANFIPSLPYCPVPLYHFPKPFPFCKYPVIASSLPRSLQPSNPNLKVHIPNPWAQSLQLFEFDPNLRFTTRTHTDSVAGLNAEIPRIKSYACYSIYVRPGHRYVTQLAPPGSTFDFAFTMFNKFFQKRVGVSWDDRESLREMAQANRSEDKIALQSDGTSDGRLFKFFGPRVIKDNGMDQLGEGEVKGVEDRVRKPSVTILVNPAENQPMDEVEARAMTPEGGW